MSWSVSGESKTRGYNFAYDNLSRLTLSLIHIYYAFMGTNGIPAPADANFKYDAETGYHTRYTASAKTFLTGTLTARLLSLIHI